MCCCDDDQEEDKPQEFIKLDEDQKKSLIKMYKEKLVLAEQNIGYITRSIATYGVSLKEHLSIQEDAEQMLRKLESKPDDSPEEKNSDHPLRHFLKSY